MRLLGAGVRRRWHWKKTFEGKPISITCFQRNLVCCRLNGSLLPPVFSKTVTYPSLDFMGKLIKGAGFVPRLTWS